LLVREEFEMIVGATAVVALLTAFSSKNWYRQNVKLRRAFCVAYSAPEELALLSPFLSAWQ
jgi:hypothetical protein